MRIAFVYDLREDYLAEGLTPEQVAEFDSTEAIDAIDGALIRYGAEVIRVGRGRNLAARLVAGERFDLVFSIAEGLRGRSREAQVPALCEMFDQPYVFSDPLTMAVTLDKSVAKRLIRDAGLPTAPFVVLDTADQVASAKIRFPAFVKPVAEGTGKGCGAASIVHDRQALQSNAALLIERFSQPVLAETYLPGREFTVGIVGTGASARIIAVLEVILTGQAEPEVYSLANKEAWHGRVQYRLAEDAEAQAAAETALKAYRVLGSRDAARLDFRSDSHGRPHFLEANPIAGLSPEHSDLPILTRLSGRSYDWLIGQVLDSAVERYGGGRVAAPMPRKVA